MITILLGALLFAYLTIGVLGFAIPDKKAREAITWPKTLMEGIEAVS